MWNISGGTARHGSRITATGLVASLVLVGALARPAVAKPTVTKPKPSVTKVKPAPSLAETATAAARYATSRGYRTGIAVIDTITGTFTGAGEYNSYFASESVVKVFIAARLLITGQMKGATSTLAYRMITQSDDSAASALYGRAGGASMVRLLEGRYGIRKLGAPPSRPGWWGSTNLTARGLAELYRALKKDPVVWPWLRKAMHHATTRGSDGTYQFFGLPSATANAAIKQGWGADNSHERPAFNSTGYVDRDRFAVVILTEGPAGTYGSPIAGVLTAQAKTLMPGGHIPGQAPRGKLTKTTTAGARVRLAGWAFDADKPKKSIKVAVYDGTTLVGRYRTTSGSKAVNKRYGLSGTHRFVIRLSPAPGTHRYRVVALNIGPDGPDVAIGTYQTTVGPVPSTTTLDTCLGAPLAGQATMLTATVAADATGSVTFRDGSAVLGTVPLTDGSAVLWTSALPAGATTVEASYSGDSRTESSTGTAAITVVEPSAGPSVIICPGAVTAKVPFTAIAAAPDAAPGDLVTFLLDGKVWSTAALTDGSAILGGLVVGAGHHVITATVDGTDIPLAFAAAG